METDVRMLKQKLTRTQDALKAATKRCRELVKELDHRVAGYESKRILQDQQFSRILRALLGLEACLKQEQKSIRQMLCEKDNVIRSQQLEIVMLRRYTKSYIKDKPERNVGNNVKHNVHVVDKNTDKCQVGSSSFLRFMGGGGRGRTGWTTIKFRCSQRRNLLAIPRRE